MIDFADFAFMPGIDNQYSADSFLYLDKVTAKNCGFYEIEISFANAKLKRCLLNSTKLGTKANTQLGALY